MYTIKYIHTTHHLSTNTISNSLPNSKINQHSSRPIHTSQSHNNHRHIRHLPSNRTTYHLTSARSIAHRNKRMTKVRSFVLDNVTTLFSAHFSLLIIRLQSRMCQRMIGVPLMLYVNLNGRRAPTSPRILHIRHLNGNTITLMTLT